MALATGFGEWPIIDPVSPRQKSSYSLLSMSRIFASFALSTASSTFSPAFSTGPFSGHALVASAIGADLAILPNLGHDDVHF